MDRDIGFGWLLLIIITIVVVIIRRARDRCWAPEIYDGRIR